MNGRITFENGVYGCRAIVTSQWHDRMADHIKSRGVVELELNMAKGWHGSDIRFLADLPDLKVFEILDLHIENVEPIHFLHKLRRLVITTYCSTEINFSNFPELESCELEWRAKAASLFDCGTLKDLFVNRYKAKDLSRFGRLTHLESLMLLIVPSTNLVDLIPLSRLRRLRLGNSKRLAALSGIERLSRLEELDISTCTAITSIKEVGELSRLRKFFFGNCGSIDSLGALDKLSVLEEVVFDASTNIVDGDLSPLLRQKHLKNVAFQNRRHYSHRREQIQEFLGVANVRA